MPSTEERIAALRAELAGLSGAARCRPLSELANALGMRYWEAGPGSPAALPYLDAAVDALEEVYGYLESGDRVRAQAAAQLGWMRGVRHLVHSGTSVDRDRAITLIEESTGVDSVPPALVTITRVVLGQLYLGRATQDLSAPQSIMSLIQTGAGPDARADADRAIACLRRAVAEPGVATDMVEATQMMLTVAESVRDLLDGMGGGIAGLDFSRFAQMFATLQAMQARFGAPNSTAPGFGGVPGFGGMPGFAAAQWPGAGGGRPGAPGSASAPGATVEGMTTGGYSPPSPFSGAALFDPKILASLPPLDRPVAIVHGSGPVPAPPAPVPRPAPVPTDLDRTRRALARRLIELASSRASAAATASASSRASAAPAASTSAFDDGTTRERDSDVVPPDGLDPGSPDLWSAVTGLLRPDASPLPVDGIDECVALAVTVVAEPMATDPVTAGTDRLLLGVSLLLRGRHDDGGWGDHDGWGVDDDWGDEGDTDLAAGAEHLLAAIELLPPEHPAATAACLGVGAFLDERHPWRGPLGRMTAQVAQRAEAVLSAGSASEEQAAVVRTVAAWCRLTVAWRAVTADPTDAGAAIDGLDAGAAAEGIGAAIAPTDAGQLLAAIAAIPADDPWRPRLAATAGLAGVAAGLAQGDAAAVRDASRLIGSVCATVESVPAAVPDRRAALPRQVGLLAAALGALADGDRVALRSAVDRLAADGSPGPAAGPPADPDADPVVAARLDAVLGAVRLALAAPEDLASATDSLARATVALTNETDETLRTASWWRLVEAYRRAGTPDDLRRARFAAIRALRDGAREVDGPSRYASWMLAGGGALEAYEALEAAAAVGADPIDPLVRDVAVVLLHLAGIDVAAAEERSHAVGPPSVAQVATALREIGAAALVYLHPVDEGPRHAGVLLLDAATERLDLIGRVGVPDLTAGPSVGWDDEAWSELVEPLLTLLPAGPGPRRVLVAATGPLAGAPLAAIPERLDRSGRYAGTGLIISAVASGRQVVELARRLPLPVTGNAVFVANPRGDREAASYEVLLLRRLFHGDSIGLGQTVERVHGRGTPAEVLAHLPGPAGPGAGLLHLGCGLRTADPPALALARPEADGGDATGSDWLDIHQIRAQASAVGDVTAGGLAILPPDAAAGGSCARFAHELLRAGLTGVIGWRWPVPEQVAALMLFVLHGKLADEGLPPADAVHEVHRWMLDPARPAPRDLPTGYAAALQGRDLTDPVYWSSLCHFGR